MPVELIAAAGYELLMQNNQNETFNVFWLIFLVIFATGMLIFAILVKSNGTKKKNLNKNFKKNEKKKDFL